MPGISIIVPVYNAGTALAACVDSALAQTFADYELLLVDDGSTDGSGALCDGYAARDPRVRVIHKPNGGGAGGARNTGMAEARGDYFAFLDADDAMEPDMLAVLYGEARDGDWDVVAGGFTSVGGGGESVTVWPDARLETPDAVRRYAAARFPGGVLGYPWNKLYRASLLQEHGLEFPACRRLEDGFFNAAVLDKAARLRVLDRPLYRYRLSGQAAGGKLPAEYDRLVDELSARWLSLLEEWGLSARPLPGALRFFYLNELVSFLEFRLLTRTADRAFLDALRRRPLTAEMTAETALLPRYARMVASRFAKGDFGSMAAAIRLKYLLKKRGGPAFYRLKRRLNGGGGV